MDGILKRMKDNSMVCNVPCMKITIPEDYFSHGLAESVGTAINTFGIFSIYVYDDYTTDSRIKNKYHMVLPTKLDLLPTNIEKEKVTNNDHTDISFQYSLVFTKGQTVVRSINLMQDSGVAFSFVNFIFEAFLPDIIGYDKIVEIWTLCNKLNSAKINVLNPILDIIISSACRDPNNIKREFRFLLNENPKTPMTSRRLTKLKDAPRYASTLTSLGAGYANEGRVVSIIRARDEKVRKAERKSPLDDKIG